MIKALPASWLYVEIEQLLQPLANKNTLQQGWSPQCEAEPATTENDWGVLKTTAIQDGFFSPGHNKQLPRHLAPRPQIEVMPGDILMTCAGPRSRCGVTCLVKKTRKRLMMSGKMYRFRANPLLLSSSYLATFLQGREAKDTIDQMKTGISDSGLNLTHDRFKRLLVPVPPPSEQARIVAKLEELFSGLDKGIESLKTAQAQLKVYRQALLKHAFEGKLTAQWRTANPDKLETADALLKRIQQERAQRYQQQLAEWEAAGKPGSKPKAPKPLTPITAEVLADVPELPQGWGHIQLGDLLNVVSGNTPKGIESTKGSEIPFYRVSDMNRDGNENLMRSSATYLSEEEAAQLGLTIFPPETIIFPKRGGAIATNKKRRLASRACFDLNLMGLTGLPPSLDSNYLWLWVLALDLAAISDGSNVPQINNRNIEPLSFPLCSYREQLQIVELAEARLSVCNELEKTLTTSLQQAEALRQSILKRAFSGQLVPQDPADEPAAALLARIRAEQAASPKAKKNKA